MADKDKISRRAFFSKKIPEGYAVLKGAEMTLKAALTAFGAILVEGCDVNSSTLGGSPLTQNNLIIGLFSDDDNYSNRINSAMLTLGGTADVIHVKDKSGDPLSAIRKAVQNYITDKRKADPNFTLDNLLFTGHGDPNNLLDGSQNTLMIETSLNHFEYFDATRLLTQMVDVQNVFKSKTQLAKRVILGECATFARLTPDYISNYQRKAKLLNADIVGSVSTVFNDQGGKEPLVGYFVKFNPDGKTVAWDQINNTGRYDSYCGMMNGNDRNVCNSLDTNKAWFEAMLAKQSGKALAGVLAQTEDALHQRG